MKDFAAWLIVGTYLLSLLYFALVSSGDWDWEFKKSPNTGICYEVNGSFVMFGYRQSMSPVDDSYCEES